MNKFGTSNNEKQPAQKKIRFNKRFTKLFRAMLGKIKYWQRTPTKEKMERLSTVGFSKRRRRRGYVKFPVVLTDAQMAKRHHYRKAKKFHYLDYGHLN